MGKSLVFEGYMWYNYHKKFRNITDKSLFKKLKQKLNLSAQIGVLFISGIAILGSLLPVFANKTVEAQVTPQGPAAACDIAIKNSNWTSWSGPSNTELSVSHSKVNENQKFSTYIKIKLTDSEVASCKANGSKDYEVSLFIQNSGIVSCAVSNYYSEQRSYPLTFDEAGKSFYARVDGISFKTSFQGNYTYGSVNTYCFNAYLNKVSDRSKFYGYASVKYIEMDFGTNNHPATTTLPTVSNPLNADKDTTIDQTKSVLASTLKVQFTAGLKDKYRLVKTDGDMNFGTTNGLEAITLDWPSGGPKLAPGQYLALTERADYSILIQTDPQYKYTRLYFASGASKFNASAACQPSMLTESCGALYSNEFWSNTANKGTGSTTTSGNLPEKFNPTLKTEGWNKSNYASKTASPAGTKLGEEKVYVIPVIWGQSRVPIPNIFLSNGGYSAYLMGKNPQLITIEIFEKEEDVINACKAENASNPAVCTAEYSRYGIGKAITATASSSETDSNNQVSQTLYGFVVRVISTIVTWLQSIIYRIFAYIVVPILNALLKVRPYEDGFVNIIYPGWLILRNLANIFFIISLLVVGLRILFQQSAAGTARGFIMRLVIMALLVNFSLVIGQGIIGIADTVQSQFLPGNTKVIEALGAKLMVEPLKSFRSEVANDDGAFSNDDAQLALADTIKPIVLLILSVAAFWSFVAIAAFLLVRLVMLWILYMLSPIAYVGFVMDETKKYAKQWWDEFIKYAIMTPVLVFFLNIAALMATVFSGSDNSLFQFSDGSQSADLVVGSLTILTHFIVLLFIFAGMKFALGSGTFGAKAIVNYAQKGFKNTFSKPAKIAGSLKDMSVDKIASGASKRGYEGFAKAITAVAKPLDFGRALKKSRIDDPLKARKGREADRLASLAGDKEKKDVLKSMREKSKDFADADSAEVRDALFKSADKRDKVGTGAAMLELAKGGNFDEILDAAEKVTKVKYNKDAAGLNAATKALGKKVGMSEAETTALLKNFDGQAKKDKSKSHFRGNTEYKDGKTRVRDLDSTVPGGKFVDTTATPDHKEWVKKQVENRTGMSFIDDLKNTGLDSMVTDGANGRKAFTETQKGVFAKTDINTLTNQDTINKFKNGPTNKISAMRDAYRNTGRADMVQYLTGQGMATADINARMTAMDDLFDVGPGNQTNQNTNNNNNNGGNNTNNNNGNNNGGGNQNPPAGGNQGGAGPAGPGGQNPGGGQGGGGAAGGTANGGRGGAPTGQGGMGPAGPGGQTASANQTQAQAAPQPAPGNQAAPAPNPRNDARGASAYDSNAGNRTNPSPQNPTQGQNVQAAAPVIPQQVFVNPTAYTDSAVRVSQTDAATQQPPSSTVSQQLFQNSPINNGANLQTNQSQVSQRSSNIAPGKTSSRTVSTSAQQTAAAPSQAVSAPTQATSNQPAPAPKASNPAQSRNMRVVTVNAPTRSATTMGTAEQLDGQSSTDGPGSVVQFANGNNASEASVQTSQASQAPQNLPVQSSRTQQSFTNRKPETSGELTTNFSTPVTPTQRSSKLNEAVNFNEDTDFVDVDSVKPKVYPNKPRSAVADSPNKDRVSTKLDDKPSTPPVPPVTPPTDRPSLDL